MLSWFRKEKPIPMVAELPGQVSDPAIEPHSPTWKFIENWAAEELEKLRRKLESPKLDLPATNAIRGEIKRLNSLTALPSAGRETAQGILNRHFAGED